jgi:hypothetical protein
MFHRVVQALSPRRHRESSPSAPSAGADTETPNTTPEETEYEPKVERKMLTRGYDSVILRQAETFLFDRNNQSTPVMHTNSRQSSMVEETDAEKKLEQAYMEYISDAVIQDIELSYGSDEDTSSQTEPVAPKKKKLPKNTANGPSIELYKSTSSLYIYDGDDDQFNETIKTLEQKGKVKEAAKALGTVGNLKNERKDYRGAMILYDRACDMYEKLGMLDLVFYIRTIPMHDVMMNLELFENLAESYESLLSQRTDKWTLELYSIMLRLSAFLKGDGSEGTYEMKERLDESTIREEKSQVYDKVAEILGLLENGNREEAELLLDTFPYTDSKLQAMLAICKKHVNT